MPFGWSEGIQLAGAAGNLIGGKSAAEAQKSLMREQKRMLESQRRTYQANLPLYNQALQQLAYGANMSGGFSPTGGYGAPPQGPGTVTMPGGQQGAAWGSRRTLPGATYAAPPPPQQGSQWGSHEDQLRLQQAEEDINRYAAMNANVLRHQANLSGLNTGVQGAMQARNQQAAAQDYSRFRRGLAIDAGREQERRLQMVLGALGPAFGAGAQASAGFGNQAGIYGNQANQMFGALSQQAQNLAQMDALRRYSQQYGVPPGGGGAVGGMMGGGQAAPYQLPAGAVDPSLFYGRQF